MAARVIHVHETEREPPAVDGQPPPQDLDAEAAVLSTILLQGAEALRRVNDIVADESFYSDANKLVFHAVTAVEKRGVAIDIVTVATELRAREQIQRVGGASYLAELVDATPAVANVIDHARAIQRLYLRRRAIAQGQKRSAEGYGDVGDEQSYLEECARDATALARRGATLASGAVTVGRSAAMALADVNDSIAASGIMGTSTGLDDLDAKTAGLHAGDYNVLTAKTGGGKTALSCGLAINVATAWRESGGQLGGGCAIFSAEMPHKQISTRMACGLGRVNWHTIRLGHALALDYSNLSAGAEKLRDLPVIIDDAKRPTMAEICAKARRFRDDFERQGIPLRLIVIDYLQKVNAWAEVPARSTDEKMLGRVAEMVVELAEELGLAIVGNAQLNDDGLVRGSRALVHEAHGWWDLDIEGKTKKGPRMATLKIKKQRHAPHPVEATCWFHPAIVSFSDLEVLP